MTPSEYLSAALFYWKHKTAEQNQWHPYIDAPQPSPDSSPQQPLWLRRPDVEAATVDAAPFVVGVGGVAHIRQALQFGFTARASVFHNVKTMTAMHRAVLVALPTVLACQAAGIEYRSFIPRWASERERRRDDDEVRTHVGFGMLAGMAAWMLRIYVFKAGRAYWAPMDVVLGGALTDLMHREYMRAHNL